MLEFEAYLEKQFYSTVTRPGRKLGNLGKLGELGILFPTFSHRRFDFDLIPKIENSKEENWEKKLRAFRAFQVFDLPLFRIFNQVYEI